MEITIDYIIETDTEVVSSTDVDSHDPKKEQKIKATKKSKAIY